MIPLGSLPEVFGFVAQMLSQKGIILDYYFLFWDNVWATKPKTSGNEPKGISNDDLGYVTQIFLPKTNGNDTMPCIFFYGIAPLDSKNWSKKQMIIIPKFFVINCTNDKRMQNVKRVQHQFRKCLLLTAKRSYSIFQLNSICSWPPVIII